VLGEKKVVCVIPARLHSSRFPKKILASLSGKPLLQWAWEGALSIPFFDEVVIAIDDDETASVVEQFGGKWVMTAKDCARGTERLAEIQKRNILKGDIWVNWQADEPFLSFQIIKDLLQDCLTSQADVWTLKIKIKEEKELQNPNVCKVVCDVKGQALYFSRSPIPYRQEKQEIDLYRHVGLYAYSNEALKEIESLPSCDIEEAESLEQLRFLFYGLKIQVHETQCISLGVDRPEDLVAAEEYLKKQRLLGLLIDNIAFNRV